MQKALMGPLFWLDLTNRWDKCYYLQILNQLLFELFVFHSLQEEGQGRQLEQLLSVVLIRTIYKNGWSVWFGNGVGQMTRENAEVFFYFLALVELLPAGEGNFWYSQRVTTNLS